MQKPNWPPSGLWIIIVIVTILIILSVGITIWLFRDASDRSLEISIILAVVFGLPGLMFAYFQWFYPRPSEEHDHAIPHSPANVGVAANEMKQVSQQPSLADPSGKTNSNTQLLPPGAAKETLQVLPASIFLFNMKLTKADEFYGRLNEREVLRSRTSAQASTSIVGPGRIGKTWLLQYLRLVAKIQLGTRFRVVYLDATRPSCARATGFIREVMHELSPTTMVLTHEQADLAEIERHVKDLLRRNIRPVLCIDEFGVLGNREQFDLDFFKGMRAIAEAGLALVVASKVPLIQIVGEPGKTSGFFNIFEQLTIGPFRAREAESFVQAKGLQAGLTVREQEMLLMYGQVGEKQWPPLHLQLAGKMLLEDRIQAEREDSDHYRPNDPSYWQTFSVRLEEKYRGVVKT